MGFYKNVGGMHLFLDGGFSSDRGGVAVGAGLVSGLAETVARAGRVADARVAIVVVCPAPPKVIQNVVSGLRIGRPRDQAGTFGVSLWQVFY